MKALHDDNKLEIKCQSLVFTYITHKSVYLTCLLNLFKKNRDDDDDEGHGHDSVIVAGAATYVEEYGMEMVPTNGTTMGTVRSTSVPPTKAPRHHVKTNSHTGAITVPDGDPLQDTDIETDREREREVSQSSVNNVPTAAAPYGFNRNSNVVSVRNNYKSVDGGKSVGVVSSVSSDHDDSRAATGAAMVLGHRDRNGNGISSDDYGDLKFQQDSLRERMKSSLRARDETDWYSWTCEQVSEWVEETLRERKEQRLLSVRERKFTISSDDIEMEDKMEDFMTQFNKHEINGANLLRLKTNVGSMARTASIMENVSIGYWLTVEHAIDSLILPQNPNGNVGADYVHNFGYRGRNMGDGFYNNNNSNERNHLNPVEDDDIILNKIANGAGILTTLTETNEEEKEELLNGVRGKHTTTNGKD